MVCWKMRHPHTVAQLYGVPHAILGVFNTILYENECQNHQLFQLCPHLDDVRSRPFPIFSPINITHLMITANDGRCNEKDRAKS
jgi:hypothetical protein